MTATKPTQSELLQGGLVDITAHHKSVETNSLKIAQNLDVQHSDVTRIIKRLIANEAISQRTVSVSDYLSDRGKLYNFYHLREVEALQVIMSLTGAKAEKLHKEIAQAFVSVKKENAEWRAQALITTSTTKHANDQIYWLRNKLAETIPTSKRCIMLFVHIQGAITKKATGKANTNRDTMTACQLLKVGELEQQVEIHIEQLNREGLPAVHIREEVIAMIKAA
ncbi:Rha family transcriptional regulator [Oceanospirillaceae bacterium]|nr:Rha family transcriptional regulator [Oceanospirillaceae bacterium]